MHVDFIEVAAHIRAFNYGLKMDLSRESREELARRAADVMVPRIAYPHTHTLIHSISAATLHSLTHCPHAHS